MNIADLANQAAEQQDMSVEVAGGNFKKELPVEGKAICRLREYIELGAHAATNPKFPKPPTPKARFIFELTHEKHQQVFQKEGQEDRIVPHTIKIDVNISQSAKGNFMKLFKQLNWKQDVKHPAQLLGRAFICTVVHTSGNDQPISENNPAKYANCNTGFGSDTVYLFEPPRVEDPLSNTVTDIPVPELIGGSDSLRLFLWDNPTKECWASLYVEGTYTKKTEGKPDEEMSLNFTQNKILSAANLEGSPLHMMLEGCETLDDLSTEAPEPTEPLANDPMAQFGV